MRWSVVVLDVAESPVERPKKAARLLLEQEEAPHAQSQVAVERSTGKILAVAVGKGREHDFYFFKRSGLRAHKDTEPLADSGY